MEQGSAFALVDESATLDRFERLFKDLNALMPGGLA